MLGCGQRARAFVPYSLASYLAQTYSSTAPFASPDGRFGNPVFAPLGLRGPVPNSFGYNVHGGGLGSVWVGRAGAD